jgi:UDP-N-acetylglucosamine 1-carboxyvinyltransferase
MYKISYSPNLTGEVTISGSKNATLPIVAANYLLETPLTLHNKPNISDVRNMEALVETAFATSHTYFDLTNDLATKFRASILLIPLGLIKYGEVHFVGSG